MSCDLPTLTVAVSTHGARSLDLRAADWPSQAGVEYLVLVQQAEVDPRIVPHLVALEAGRDDVTVLQLTTTGLSRSRNAALDHAQGDIVLLADDDVAHAPGATEALRRAFAEDPELALVAGCSFCPDGNPRKPGQDRARTMTRLNAARISSHELAFRRAPVLAAGFRFDERFGAGADTEAFLGEEYIFAADCLKAGLKGCHLPIPVSIHPPESSGFVWKGSAAARARARVLTRVFGPWAPLMRLAFATKNARRFGSVSDLAVFLSGR